MILKYYFSEYKCKFMNNKRISKFVVVDKNLYFYRLLTTKHY